MFALYLLLRASQCIILCTNQLRFHLFKCFIFHRKIIFKSNLFKWRYKFQFCIQQLKMCIYPQILCAESIYLLFTNTILYLIGTWMVRALLKYAVKRISHFSLVQLKSFSKKNTQRTISQVFFYYFNICKIKKIAKAV